MPPLLAVQAAIRNIRLVADSILGGRKMICCPYPNGALRKEGTFWDLVVPG